MEQTAVEWLVNQLNKKGFAQVVTDEEIKQAKEIEQVQDTKRLLFFYKVSLIIGLKKAGKLLKEVDKEIKQEPIKSE